MIIVVHALGRCHEYVKYKSDKSTLSRRLMEALADARVEIHKHDAERYKLVRRLFRSTPVELVGGCCLDV